MKISILTIVAGLALGLQAQAALYDSGLITVGSTIPTQDPHGTSTHTVSGLMTIDPGSVRVYLSISGGIIGDLWVQLQGPSGSGAQSILLNRVGLTAAQPGGFVNPGYQGWLYDSAAGGNIHANGGSYSSSALLTGDFAPDGRNIASNSSGTDFDNTSPTRMLSQFDGINPNGTWTLRFFDDVGGAGSASTLDSWSLQLTAVPEPINVALGVFGVVFAGVAVGRRLRARARA